MKTPSNLSLLKKTMFKRIPFSIVKVKSAILIISFCLIHLPQAFSQTQFQTVFSQPTKSLGPRSVQQDADGYIIATNTGINETTIIKTNASGVIVWNKTFEGNVVKIIPVSTGGYIMTGTITQTGQLVGLIIKIDASGKSIWSKVFDTIDPFGINLYDIIETIHGSNQAFAITGVVSRKLVGGTGYASDVFGLKITNTGSVIWVRAYGRNTYAVYENLQERGRQIHEVASSDPLYPDYIITGQCDGYNTSGVDALYIVKVNGTDGTMNFDKIYTPLYPNGDPLHQDFFSEGISTIDGSGDIIVICRGYLIGNITKLSNTGSITWSKNYNISFGDIDYTSSGYVLTSGTTIVKTTTSGAVSWGKDYSAYGDGYLDATSDGGFVLAGSILVTDESNNAGCLLVKTNSAGESACYESSLTVTSSTNSIQVAALNGDDPDISSEIAITTGTGETAICLNTYERVCNSADDFEYVSGAPVAFTVSEATIATKTLYYINEADETWPQNYSIKWTLIESVGGVATYTDVTDHSDDDANTFYSTLRTNSGFRYFINPTVRTDKSLCVDVTYAGCRARECFGANPVIGGANFRETATDQSTNTIEDISDISAYPNPAKDNLTLLIPNGESSFATIYDVSGKKVKTFSVNEMENQLYVGDLSSGLYIINITQANGSTNIKLEIK